MQQTGYVNGSDLLMKFGSGAVGHCTSHTATYSTETKDVAVKPAASVDASNASLYKSKRIIGLSVQVKADGAKFYSEGESGFKQALGYWKSGQPIQVSLFERENDDSPYCSGNFIITSLEESNPASEDASYSITLDNDGPVTIDESNLDLLSDDDDDDDGDDNGGGSSQI